MLIRTLLKLYVISIILVFSTQCIYLTKLDAAEDLLDTSDSILIKETVNNAVNDNRWFNASSQEEVKSILDDYYTGPLLDVLTADTWKFVQQCTDWPYQVSVEEVKITYLTNDSAVVNASLKDKDLYTGNEIHGLAVYNLIKTENNWRIISDKYKWE
ncbi:hypothetical protein [Desulfolucanica intricata]|uniref:hypothetical protein n=1 Tax=Desulfolucanica intricata TaxID=1285191 RepID=UPI0008343146|nr:hypothetical protein [Desulfolucanica intricata]